MIVMGIDPGLNGGWGIIHDGKVFDSDVLIADKAGKYKIPVLDSLVHHHAAAVDAIVLEEQAPLEGNPVKSLAQQMTGYGFLLSQLWPYKEKVILVNPVTWTRHFIGAGMGESKSQCGIKLSQQSRVREIIPGLPKHDGCADALAIAWWFWASRTGMLRHLKAEHLIEKSKVRLSDSWKKPASTRGLKSRTPTRCPQS